MNPWAVLIGCHADGVDDVIESIGSICARRNIRFGGVQQERIVEDGERVGYDLIDLSTSQRLPMARKAKSNEPTILCDLAFDLTVFETVTTWVNSTELDVVLLSAGGLEARQQGHWPTINNILSGSPRLLLLHVRPSVLAPIVLRLENPVAAIELPATNFEIEEFGEEIVNLSKLSSTS